MTLDTTIRLIGTILLIVTLIASSFMINEQNYIHDSFMLLIGAAAALGCLFIWYGDRE